MLTCVIAIFSYFVISDFPERASWISEEEKEFLRVKLRADVGDSKIDDSITFKRFFSALKDCECFD